MLAFGLNWLWEMVQMPAYAEMAGATWGQTAGRCGRAALGDVTWTFGIYGVVALAVRRARWGLDGGWRAYLASGALGAAAATWIESQALAAGRWSYTAVMPVVPALGVGLWPVLQLALLTPAVLWAARRACRRPRPSPANRT